MALTENQKRYMKDRRARLAKRGICVDCQNRRVKPGLSQRKKPHVCCEVCLQARRDRWTNGAMPPLFRAIEKSERIH
jgi:hypothetical protein